MVAHLKLVPLHSGMEPNHLTEQFTMFMRRRRRAAGTIRLRLFYLEKFNAFLGTRALVEASTDDMYDFLDANDHWAGGTQQSVVATLRAFYGWAASKGHLPSDPAEELWAEKFHRPPARIASEESIKRSLDGATVEDQAMILLGAECGLRVAEIANLQMSHRHDDFLTIIGKGNRQRTVHLSAELAILLTMIENTTMKFGNYFPGQYPRKPIHPSTAWRRITKILGSNPHSLRHRAGSVAYKKSGNDLRLAQVMLGHSSPVTTAIYVHVQDDDLRRASDATRIAA